MITLAMLLGLAYKVNGGLDDKEKGIIPTLLSSRPVAECARFKDKFLEGALSKIEEGVKGLSQQYPGIQKPNLNYGLRGTRYFIEFPITGKNVDAFSILSQT